MNQEETIKLLQEENRQLKREIEKLLEYIKELEARLAQYENAHAPPSLRRDRNRKKGQDKGSNGNPVRKSDIKV